MTLGDLPVLLVALGTVGVLSVLATMLFRARRQVESLEQARREATNILHTVEDGLFLLDRNLVICATYSSALEALFRRTDIAGVAFETVLKNIVSEKTVAATLKFVATLWSARTHEKPVNPVNPLAEVEIRFDVGNGRFDTRYLQFEFHRASMDGTITQLLVSVSDISAQVELARKFQVSQSQDQARGDGLLGIVDIDPERLTSFLNDSNAAMKMINAVMREPAREEGMFRRKLDSLFREANSVKGKAAALGLSSIESRAHWFEKDLKLLREKSDLSGSDFLPLAIKLDDMLTHLQSVGELASRLQPVSSDAIHADTAVIADSPGAAAESDVGFRTALHQLAARTAMENDKQTALQFVGFNAIPEQCRRIVNDIAVQAIRNAIMHGIEAPSARLAAGKLEQGQVRLIFQVLGNAGYKFSVEDDGQGLQIDRIKEVAIKKRLITQEQAAAMGAKQTYSLLFHAGFSMAENPTPEAVRGAGMNLIADLIRQVGGFVRIATVPGRFMRLTVTLPLTAGRAEDTAAA